jgi:hypothetical protein
MREVRLFVRITNNFRFSINLQQFHVRGCLVSFIKMNERERWGRDRKSKREKDDLKTSKYDVNS